VGGGRVFVNTNVVIFPFDLFGGGGSAAGAQLLADALREMLDDNKRERIATRARAYQDQIRLQEFTFDKLPSYEDWRSTGRRAVRKTLQKGEFLVWIAGNHLGALPVYDEISQQRDDTLVVQLDAHLDVYNLADCTTALSHGNFLLHCDGKLPTIVNLGHRELLLRPEYVQRYYHRTFSAAELAIDPQPALTYLRESCATFKRILLDIDCDVFDPAFFPAVGHALPFGLPPHLALRIIDALWSDRIIGLSLSEFEPARDANDRSLTTLVWLVEYLFLRKYESSPSK
jgi:arginase family enzyme